MVEGECVDLAEAIQGGHRGNRAERRCRSRRGFANDLLAGLGIPTADRHAPHDLRVRGPRRKGCQPQGSDLTLSAEHEIKPVSVSSFGAAKNSLVSSHQTRYPIVLARPRMNSRSV